MKILRKVSTKEVKRCFVIPSLIHAPKGKRYLGRLPEEDFLKKLAAAKKKGLAMNEKQLDKIVGMWPKRLIAYNGSDWHLAEVETDEIGVWRRAGGLPTQWTNSSLKETAKKVSRGLTTKSKHISARARRAIPNMLKTNTQKLQEEKYLLPIIFSNGTGTNGRRGLKKMVKGDIDDGNMRSIVLAISGKKMLRAYFGFPKKSKLAATHSRSQH